MQNIQISQINNIDKLIKENETLKLKLKKECQHCGQTKVEDQDSGESTCMCCDHLRCSPLRAQQCAEENLDTLLDELCEDLASSNTPDHKTFHEIKQQFLEDNYQDIQKGAHVHPEIFITDKAPTEFADPSEDRDEAMKNTNDLAVYNLIKSQFEQDDSFFFHGFKNGIDHTIIKHFCDKQIHKLDSGSASVDETEDKMSKVSKLALLDWKRIEKDVQIQSDDMAVKCKEKIEIFKSKLTKQSDEKGYLVVSLSLASVIYFGQSCQKSQFSQIKKYLEALHIPDIKLPGVWNILGFETHPDRDPDPSDNNNAVCDSCEDHILWKSDFEDQDLNLRDKIQKLIDKEGNKLIAKKGGKVGRKQNDDMKERMKQVERDCYQRLISNLIILSNMELLSDNDAVGEVMSRLTGSRDRIIGPGNPKLLCWDRPQKNLVESDEEKVLITSDYGCGKSLLVHKRIQKCSEKDQTKKDNFMISFLQSSSKAPHVRGILEITNKLHYTNKNVRVIDYRDIKRPGSTLRSDLGLPPVSEDDGFKLIFDLSARYREANIAADEVLLEELVTQEKIHHDNFKGSIWFAAASVSSYDFKPKQEQADYSIIPALQTQGFINKKLTKNMRNGSKLLEKSFHLQDGVIEKGTMKANENNSKEKPMEKPWWKSFSEATTSKAKKGVDVLKTTFGISSSKKEVDQEQQVPSSIKGAAGVQQDQTADDKDNVEEIAGKIEARVVKDGKTAVYEGPKKEAVGNPLIPGKEPRLLKGDQTSQFLLEEIPLRCQERKETIVLLGNDKDDVNWAMEKLATINNNEEFITVYNPSTEEEVDASEAKLKQFLSAGTGCLVTQGSLFNGMEAATTVLVFNNPYSSKGLEKLRVT